MSSLLKLECNDSKFNDLSLLSIAMASQPCRDGMQLVSLLSSESLLWTDNEVTHFPRLFSESIFLLKAVLIRLSSYFIVSSWCFFYLFIICVCSVIFCRIVWIMCKDTGKSISFGAAGLGFKPWLLYLLLGPWVLVNASVRWGFIHEFKSISWMPDVCQ